MYLLTPVIGFLIGLELRKLAQTGGCPRQPTVRYIKVLKFSMIEESPTFLESIVSAAVITIQLNR